MKLKTYKGCTITRTRTTTVVRRANGTHSWDAVVPLFAIEGAITKAEGLRPFLTSFADAKRYISARWLEIDASVPGEAPADYHRHRRGA